MKNLIRVYIVEDAAIARASLEAMLVDNNFEVVASAAKAENAWDDLQILKVDLILLDINLAGDKNGIWLAQKVREDLNIPIIYLTAYGDQKTLKEVTSTKPNGYLMKPYSEATLITTMNIALENFHDLEKENDLISNSVHKEHFFVRKKNKVVKISIKSINYIQVQQKYCKIQNDGDFYLVRMTLKKIIEILPEKKFKQVHRSFLINLEKIKEIYFEDNLIILDSGEKIPFSNYYKAEFRKDNDILC